MENSTPNGKAVTHSHGANEKCTAICSLSPKVTGTTWFFFSFSPLHSVLDHTTTSLVWLPEPPIWKGNNFPLSSQASGQSWEHSMRTHCAMFFSCFRQWEGVNCSPPFKPNSWGNKPFSPEGRPKQCTPCPPQVCCLWSHAQCCFYYLRRLEWVTIKRPRNAPAWWGLTLPVNSIGHLGISFRPETFTRRTKQCLRSYNLVRLLFFCEQDKKSQ